jgi:hypothetical protein
MRRVLPWLAALVISPVWADHPLFTEDTDVLDKGQWELELHGERARDRQDGVTTRSSEIVAKLARGVADKVEAEIELPYLREVTNGGVAEGRGDASLSLKWRFYESERLSLAFKPSLLVPTGRDELGLGAGKMRWGTALAAAYELGKVELLGHLGYTHNRNRIGERKELWHVSAAVRYAVTEKLKLVVDAGHESNPDPAAGSGLRDFVYGVLYDLRENIELGFGLKHGLNDEADDRAVRAGIKIRW